MLVIKVESTKLLMWRSTNQIRILSPKLKININIQILFQVIDNVNLLSTTIVVKVFGRFSNTSRMNGEFWFIHILLKINLEFWFLISESAPKEMQIWTKLRKVFLKWAILQEYQIDLKLFYFQNLPNFDVVLEWNLCRIQSFLESQFEVIFLHYTLFCSSFSASFTTIDEKNRI